MGNGSATAAGQALAKAAGANSSAVAETLAQAINLGGGMAQAVSRAVGLAYGTVSARAVGSAVKQT